MRKKKKLETFANINSNGLSSKYIGMQVLAIIFLFAVFKQLFTFYNKQQRLEMQGRSQKQIRVTGARKTTSNPVEFTLCKVLHYRIFFISFRVYLLFLKDIQLLKYFCSYFVFAKLYNVIKKFI